MYAQEKAVSGPSFSYYSFRFSDCIQKKNLLGLPGVKFVVRFVLFG